MPAVTIVKWGGITVIASLLLVSAIFAMQFEQVRFGGELHRKNQQVSDLVADILPPPEYVIEAYLETTKLLQNPATLPERRARLSKLRDEYLAREKYWRQSDLDPALKRQLLDASAKEAQAFWRDVDGAFLPAIASGDMAAAQQAYARVDADYRNHRTHIDRLVTMAAAQQTAVRDATMSKIGAVKILLATFAAMLIAMVGAAIWFSMSRIAHPLRRITAALGRLADGDMEVTVDTPQKKDEIGDLSRALIALRDQLKASYAQIGQQTDMIVSTVGEALSQLAAGNLGYRLTAALTGPFAPLKDNYNDAAQSLEQAMAEVGHASSGVDAAAAEIRCAADDLAKRTELQASTVTETAAAVEHLAGSVGRTAQCSDDAQRLVIEARENAANSKLVAQDAVSAMTDIERSSAEISQIVELINGIAFQTNLLALNAGVEAARAGDAGKGFAVVASEVRVLALRTAEAASDIKARVANSGRLVTNGVRMVAESGAAIDDIIERITKVSDIVVSIAGDAITQADTLRQVNLAVQDMDRSTHQNAAMAEQTTAAVQNLAMQARDLKQQVSQFLSDSDAGYGTADGAILAA